MCQYSGVLFSGFALPNSFIFFVKTEWQLLRKARWKINVSFEKKIKIIKQGNALIIKILTGLKYLRGLSAVMVKKIHNSILCWKDQNYATQPCTGSLVAVIFPSNFRTSRQKKGKHKGTSLLLKKRKDNSSASHSGMKQKQEKDEEKMRVLLLPLRALFSYVAEH